VGAYLIMMMFSIGLLVGGEERADHAARKRERRLLMRSLILQIVVLPATAWAILHAFHARGHVALAILALASAPGGRLLPNLARRAHGDLGLSVEIALWLAKLTAFTAPVTLALLGDVHRVHLHELRIIAALLGLQLLPYLAGRALRRRRPQFSTQIAHPLEVVRGALIILALAIIIAHGRLATVRFLGEIGWLAAFFWSVLALSLGWLVGGPSAHVRRTFALSANMHDLALAMTLATMAFPGMPIELPVVGVWLITFGCSLFFSEVVGRPHQVGEEVLA
jgi:BASS family bile acid:Na+ symporter